MHSKKIIPKLAMVVIGTIAAFSVEASTITFEGPAAPFYNPQTLNVDGYSFSNNAYTDGLGYGHGIENIDASPYFSPYYQGNQSNVLYFAAYGDNYEMITNASPFQLASLDVGAFMGFVNGPQNLYITGEKAQGGSVVASLPIAASGFTSFVLADYIIKGSDFSNLISLKIGGLNDGYVWIDNLDVQMSAVPLPGAAVLMLSGLGLGGLAMRRRKQVA